MSDRDIAEWIVVTCLIFGASVATAYKVAGLFIEAIHQKPAAEGGTVPG